VSASPAAFTATTSVVWSAEFTALSTMSFVEYMAWTPTMTASSFAAARGEAAIIAASSVRPILVFIRSILHEWGSTGLTNETAPPDVYNRSL
jgi:hypothetical protein